LGEGGEAGDDIRQRVFKPAPGVASVAGDVGGKVFCGEKSVRTGQAAVRPSLANTYGERMQAALDAINRPDYPTDMILRLEQAYPRLYAKLTSRIPDEIDLAWRCQAPLPEFDAILARLVSTHRQACALCRAAQPEGTKLGQKSPVASERRGQLGGDDGHSQLS